MAFLGCRMISISLEHGVCEDTVYGMVLYRWVRALDRTLVKIRTHETTRFNTPSRQLYPLSVCARCSSLISHFSAVTSSMFRSQFSAVLCQQCKLVSDIREACRVGNIGMSMLKRWVDSSDILPKVTHCYYGFVALHTLPLQECSDNLRKGFEGMYSRHCVCISLYIQ